MTMTVTADDLLPKRVTYLAYLPTYLIISHPIPSTPFRNSQLN